MVTGPFINASAVLVGGVLGALLSQRLPERIRTSMTSIFGLASLGIGILLVIKCANLPVMVLSTLVGTLLGEICNMEKGINTLVSKLQQLISAKGKKKASAHESYIQSYVAIIVLFCASGTGVFGAMREGMTGDASILIAKAFLDFFHCHHFRLHPGHCRRRHQRADAAHPADSCGLRGDHYAAYYPDDAGGFQRRRRYAAGGHRAAHLRDKNVCGGEYAACAGAGDANFSGLDAVFCPEDACF